MAMRRTLRRYRCAGDISPRKAQRQPAPVEEVKPAPEQPQQPPQPPVVPSVPTIPLQQIGADRT